jgi:hypothetical protein
MLKNTEQFLRENNLLSVNEWKVPSKSEKGKFHTVGRLSDGKFTCDCPAGSLNKPCRHKRIIYNQINNITKSEYETL